MSWIVRIGRKDDCGGYRYAAKPGYVWSDGSHKISTDRLDEARVFDTYNAACMTANRYTWGEAIPASIFPTGTHVMLFKGMGDDDYKEENDTFPGVVVGMSTVLGISGKEMLTYIVRLDEGFYDPHGGFVAFLVVHPDNLRSTEEETYAPLVRMNGL